MRLRALTFRNFCQHSHRQLEFEDGVTFLVGPCGSGKSNTFRGIKASLTGDLQSRDLGGKSQEITYGAKSDEAYISTTWEMDDARRMVVFRNLLKSGKASLTLSDGQKFEGKEQDVTDKVLQFSGMTLDIINSCMFISQGAVGDIFSMRPSDVVKQLISLTDAGRAQDLIKGIQPVLSQDLVRMEDYDESELANAEREYDKAKQAYAHQRQAHQVISLKQLFGQKLQKCKDTLDDYEKRQGLSRDIKDQKENIQRIEEDVEDAKQQLEKCNQREKKEREQFHEQERQLKTAESEFQAIKAVKEAYELLQELERGLKRDLPNEPKQPKEGKRPEESTLTALIQQMDKQEEIIQMFEDKQCVTCKRPFEIEEEQYKAAKQELKSLEKQHDRLSDLKAQWDDFEREYRQWQRSVEQATSYRKKLQKQRETMRVKATEPFDSEAFEQANRKVKRLETEKSEQESRWEEARTAGNDAAQNFAQIRGELTQALSHLSTLQLRKQKLPKIEKSVYVAAKKTLQEQEKLREKIKSAYAVLRDLQTQYVVASRRFRAARAQRRRINKIKPTTDILKEAVEVCRVLPRLAISRAAQQMEQLINQKLYELGMDFTLSVDDNLNFIVTRYGHRFIHKRMSGGQKCVAGIAFWNAMAQTMGIRCMFLDEPIDGFDPQAEASLDSVFTQIDNVCRKEKRQFIVITHHQRLAQIGKRHSFE